LRTAAWLRGAVALLGFGGGLLFAAAFVYSFINPVDVEQRARVAIEAEVRSRVDAHIERLDGSGLSAIARRLSDESQAKVERVRQQLKGGLPARIAGISARMRNLDCECRRQVEANASAWLQGSILVQEDLQARLESLIRTKYMEVAGQVLREFRIFTGVNAAVLLLLGVAVVAKRKAGVHLVPAAVVLVVASVVVGYFYLFQQDWLHTLVFGDYVGLWYLGYLATAALLLGDLLVNRARVTAHLISALLGAMGSVIVVVPC
jgi:hypothetical protein